MVNMQDEINLHEMVYGYRDEFVKTFYDKCMLFKKDEITEINYIPGAHLCKPRGKVRYNNAPYKMYHFNHLSPDYKVQRYKLYASRLSKENIEKGWGGHYLESESVIRAKFAEARQKATKLL